MPLLYRFMSTKNVLQTLESMRLRIGRIADLNDPFDCAIHFTGARPRDVAVCEEITRTIFARRNESLGVLCFTRTWREPVLWSHYADSHRGMALVLHRAAGADLRRVKYSRRRKSVAVQHLDQRDEEAIIAALGDSFFVKSPTWAYEKEVRILVELNKHEISGGSYFAGLPKEMIRGVILGLRCDFSPGYLRKLFQHIGVPRAKVWRAKKSATGFSLDREEA
jgi:hypothetical protein